MTQKPLPGMPKAPPPCKDCKAAGLPLTRKATYTGPRCKTHWNEARKAQRDKAHRAKVNQTYSFADADHYDRLYKFQDGLCPLCRRAKGTGSKRLAVDHDHQTDEVRGLLCSTCNQILGHFRDDPNAFARCIAYLHDPPYRRMLREYAKELLEEG